MSPIIFPRNLQSSSFLVVLNKISTREYLDDDGEVLMGVIRMGAGAGMGGRWQAGG